MSRCVDRRVAASLLGSYLSVGEVLVSSVGATGSGGSWVCRGAGSIGGRFSETGQDGEDTGVQGYVLAGGEVFTLLWSAKF